MKEAVVIFGAGGHAKVVKDVLELSNWRIVAYVDTFTEVEELEGIPVYSDTSKLAPQKFIVAIGNNTVRQKCFLSLTQLGWQPITAIHPSAIIAKTATIGSGTVVMPGCIVNSDSRIGQNCIINSKALIEHDCVIGDHVHIAPGATLGGSCEVGIGCLVGIGATLLPQKMMKERSILGAGAVLIKNLEADKVAYGIPAKSES
ncbi:MAG: acetyltransferase [Candidatus Melainabacteria bacterium]|nr:MAG: acetyltransferase [Candidatus Melainabacteria bacterium]